MPTRHSFSLRTIHISRRLLITYTHWCIKNTRLWTKYHHQGRQKSQTKSPYLPPPIWAPFVKKDGTFCGKERHPRKLSSSFLRLQPSLKIVTPLNKDLFKQVIVSSGVAADFRLGGGRVGRSVKVTSPKTEVFEFGLLMGWVGIKFT